MTMRRHLTRGPSQHRSASVRPATCTAMCAIAVMSRPSTQPVTCQAASFLVEAVGNPDHGHDWDQSTLTTSRRAGQAGHRGPEPRAARRSRLSRMYDGLTMIEMHVLDRGAGSSAGIGEAKDFWTAGKETSSATPCCHQHPRRPSRMAAPNGWVAASRPLTQLRARPATAGSRRPVVW